jgi:hypothetical protein
MTTVDKIVDLIREAENPIWAIVYANNPRGNYLFRSESKCPNVENVNEETSYAYLRDCLNYLGPGKYIIRHDRFDPSSKRPPLTGTGFYEAIFIVPESAGARQPGIGQYAGAEAMPMIPGIYGPGGIQDYISGQVKAKLDEIEKTKLQREVEELRQKAEDPSGFQSELAKVMGYINNNAPHVWIALANRFVPAGPPRMAGPSPAPVEQPVHEENEEVLKATAHLTKEQLLELQDELARDENKYAAIILRLRVGNPQLLGDLSKLADIAEKQPDMYNMLLNSLRSLPL